MKKTGRVGSIAAFCVFAAQSISSMQAEATEITLPSPKPSIADLNSDGVLDTSDYDVFSFYYGGLTDPTTDPLPGDFNGDGLIDGADLSVVADEFKNAGLAVPSPGPGDRRGEGAAADLNFDGAVNASDFNVFAFYYGGLTGGSLATLPSDFNSDGRVDSIDYGVLLAASRTVTEQPGAPSTIEPSPINTPADLNRDGTLDSSDYEIFAFYYGGLTDPAVDSLPADFNDDGFVDATDLDVMVNAYRDQGLAASPSSTIEILADADPADMNFDGAVNVADFRVFAFYYGAMDALEVGGLPADLNSDGRVDVTDYGIFASSMSSGSGPIGSVPEPGSLLLVGVAALSAALHRRR